LKFGFLFISALGAAFPTFEFVLYYSGL